MAIFFFVEGEGGDGEEERNCGDGDDETPAIWSSILSR